MYQYNPYMSQYIQPLDQLGQLRAQQYTQPVMQAQMPGVAQVFGINGKFVKSVDSITANDVPMDGSVAYFPKSDGMEIYAKSWNSDGTIKTVVYRPISEQSNDFNAEKNTKFDLSDESTNALMTRFDDISERLEKMEKSMQKSSSTRNRKGADAE